MLCFVTAKDRLFNDVVMDMKREEIKFPGTMANAEISRYMLALVDTLWYLDGTKEKIQRRALNQSGSITRIPERFMNNYNGYNDYKRKKIKAPQLDSASLKTHVACLQTLMEQKFVSLWGDYGKDLEHLAVSMSEYAQFLDLSSKAQQDRQSLPHPVRQLAENVQVLHFNRGPKKTMYSLIEDLVNTKDFYEPIIFDECLHAASPFKNRTEAAPLS
ncbi:uncharacterized protein LOC125298354 [Alosa alosa]|uniref:uncharacterized protein LOC125298354 n=1 Tax=Alosa alosa TaxID=278164 RepID=UPI00201531A0|nr:uncharacterized protein LOC125298354 [Alosa alosa]